MKKRFITSKQAIKLLPDKDQIHTFYNMPFALLGADWNREDLIAALNAADKIEISGEHARNMNHGLAMYNDDAILQSDILFVETDKEKLDKFDPIKEGTDADRD